MSERDRIRHAALEAARAQGCTCKPTVTLARREPVWHAQVAHDDWCPLQRSRDTADADAPTGPIVIVPPGWRPSQR